jgi:hypothetical protein
MANTKAPFNALKKLSLKKRMDVAKDGNLGSTLLNSLTPTEFAMLFPKYYQKMLPDVGGFRLALTRKSQQQQEGYLKSLEREIVTLGGSSKSMEEFRRKYIEESSRGGRAAPRVPQLSEQQSKAFEAVQKGAIDVDSEFGRVFSGLTKDKLASVGIERYTQDGKSYYRYVQPDVSAEEAKRRLKTGASGGSLAQNQGIAYQAAINEGLSPSAARALVANMSRESLANPSNFKEDHNSRGEFVHMQRGIVAWDDVRSERIKKNFGKYPNEMSVAEQTRVAIWEMKTYRGEFPGVWDTMNNPDASPEDKVAALVSHYEKPAHPETEIRERSKLLAGINTQGLAVKPEGPNGEYSDTQISKMMEQLRSEKNAARRQQLANILADAGAIPSASAGGTVQVAGVSMKGGWIQPIDEGAYKAENFRECATLSKAFNPEIGAASGWKVKRDDAAIQPGVVVATSKYNDASGGAPKQGYHTGVALTSPDANGNFKILDQSAGHQPKVTIVNVNNYNYGGRRSDIQGNYWGIINGNTKRSMAAVKYAYNIADDETRSQLAATIKGAETGAIPERNLAETKPDQLHQEISAPKEVIEKVVTEAPAPNREEVVKEQAKAQPAAARYRFDEKAFVAEVRAKETGAFLVSDDYILDELRKGFRETPGVTYKDGVLTVSDPNSPVIQKVLADMKEHNFDSTKFMNQIKEEKKPEKKPEVKPVEQKHVVHEQPKAADQHQHTPEKSATATEQPKQENSPKVEPAEHKKVPGAADGGSFFAPDGVMPFNLAKGDDTLAINPRTGENMFSYGSNESISYNPNTNKVNIAPAGRERDVPGPQMDMPDYSKDISDLSGRLDKMMEVLRDKGDKPVQVRPSPEPVNDTPNLIQNLMETNRTPYQTPSFLRAMARANGKSDYGDDIKGHYSHGNTH